MEQQPSPSSSLEAAASSSLAKDDENDAMSKQTVPSSSAEEDGNTTSNSNNSSNDDDDDEQGKPQVDEDDNASSASSYSTSSEETPPPPPSFWQRLYGFYCANEFLILVICAILLARAYPPLGAEYLAPHITATWIAVCIIFVMAGLGLKTEEFSKAFSQLWFNLMVQGYNFGVVSAIVFVVSRGLESSNILSQDLADGMVVCASLPMTINMVLVLTKASGGDESLAIVNAAFGNLVGVFLSPVLILGYLGVTGDIDLVQVFYKLALRVVLPVAIGQIIQKKVPTVVAFYKQHKKKFKTLQEYCLVFIVYTVFCRTFEDGSDSSIADVFLMIGFLLVLLLSLMALAWVMLRFLFRDEPHMRVMGLFGCTHKTVAMGVPLINAIYEDNPAVGLYTLPLLIWHPMQLVIGTFLAPRLADFVDREEMRLERERGEEKSVEEKEEGNEEQQQDAEAGVMEQQQQESSLLSLQDEPPSEQLQQQDAR